MTTSAELGRQADRAREFLGALELEARRAADARPHLETDPRHHLEA